MKTIAKIFMAAIVCMAIASCVQDKTPVVKTYRAVCDLDVTKASLADDGHAVNWANDDKITIWYKIGGGFASTEARIVENNGTSAVFEYSLPDPALDFTVDLTTLYAVYGQSESESVIVGKTDLQAVKNGFDPKGLVMCAKYEGDGVNHSFAFRNFSSLLKIEIDNKCKNSSISKLVLTAEPTSDRYSKFPAKSSWEINNDGACSITLQEAAAEGITVNGTFETGVYYIPVLAFEGSVYPITATFYDANGNAKAFTNKYSVKPDRNTILPFGNFEPNDSWFPASGGGEEKVLFESAFDKEGVTAVTSFRASSTEELDGVQWNLTYVLLTTYFPIDGTSHLLMSVRSNQTESIAESGNLLSKQATVTSFVLNMSRKVNAGKCEISYYNGQDWVVVDDDLQPTHSSSASYDYTFTPDSPVTTSDFRVKLRYYFDAAPGSHRFLHFESIKVMGK